MPRKAANVPPQIQALNLGKPQGALQIPATRRPSRSAMGGSAPRGARTRLPPALGAAAPAAKAAPMRARKSKPKQRRKNV